MANALFMLALFLCIFFSRGANAQVPYDWGAALTLEAVNTLEGGIKKGSRELVNVDLNLTINTAAAGWWQDGEWFIYGLGNAGKNPSDYTGDLQGISNIAADQAVKIYEFWYQHQFAEQRLKILLGLHDYNSTFYSIETAGLFTHPSFGIGPDTAQVGPSIFSTTATALHITLQGEHQYLLAATYDGIAGDPDNPRGTHIQFNQGDGLFNALEWGWRKDATKIALGFWQHTATVENPVDGIPSDNNSGFYLIGETPLTENRQLFLQLGRAAEKTNQLQYYAGTGVVFNHLWREGDNLGFAVAHARNGQAYLKHAQVAENSDIDRAETAWELTYFLPLLNSMNVQTSVYYIQNPAMNKSLDDALALGVRFYFEI